jgi:hypothetical protein
MTQGEGPEFKPQYCKKRKERKKENVTEAAEMFDIGKESWKG